MVRKRDLTLAEAKQLADKWEDMADGYREAQQLASRFSDAGPHRVIEMWETGRNERGQRLSKFEVQALGERWAELFGCHPPDMGNGATPAAPAAPPMPLPADDTMLRIGEVIRLTGLSKSTIKRHVAAGAFPPWVKLSTRRVGWPASSIKAWLAKREDGTPSHVDRQHRGRLH